ncbi:MAG: hypothetical protein ACKPCG_18700 [Dolichospermum sp.]
MGSYFLVSPDTEEDSDRLLPAIAFINWSYGDKEILKNQHCILLC